MTNGVYIGTSGWSYKHWKGLFYPEKMPAGKYLEYYISQFGCAELNASFYRLPTEKTVENWSKLIPRNFRLAVKLSRQITHYKRLKDSEDELKTFIDLFRPLHDRIGPILVQLPPSLKYDNNTAESFYKVLKTDYSTFKFVIEARHQSWFVEEAFGLAREYKIGWTIAESGGRYPREDVVTSDIVYIRFHGPGKSKTTGYTENELSDWAKKIRSWADKKPEVWVFFNNDGEGHAIMNARSLTDLLK
jgi:uncharacterized protein YecE (DUF72 family)